MFARKDVVRAAFSLVGLHTQRSQAEAIGTHWNTLSRMYQGFQVHRSTALAIARVTGRDVADLFTVEPEDEHAGKLAALVAEPEGVAVAGVAV